MDEGEYGKAIADLTKVIRADPDQARAYITRGVAYNRKGEYDKAIADCTAAIRINPTDADAYYYRGYAYGEQSEPDKAEADFAMAKELRIAARSRHP